MKGFDKVALLSEKHQWFQSLEIRWVESIGLEEQSPSLSAKLGVLMLNLLCQWFLSSIRFWLMRSPLCGAKYSFACLILTIGISWLTTLRLSEITPSYVAVALAQW